MGSSPSDSPSRINFTSNRVGHSVQQEREKSPRASNDGSFVQDSMAILRRPGDGTEDPENADDCSDDLAIFRDQCEKQQKPLDFENNGFIWFPPPPDDEDDEEESNFFEYDDEDDDIGESGAMFSSSTSLASMFPAKEKQNEGHKEPLKAVVQGHFRALVSQLLQGEDINVGEEDSIDKWLDIVATLALQAANFVKPDTSRGGSMDPGDYVKVKCIASGSPHERYDMAEIFNEFHMCCCFIPINIYIYFCFMSSFSGLIFLLFHLHVWNVLFAAHSLRE